MAIKQAIMTEMQDVQDDLEKSMEKVKIIERKLATMLLTTKKRKKLEAELEEVKEVLKNNEDKLHHLQNRNIKTFIITGCLVMAYLIVSGFYQLIQTTSTDEE